MRPGRPQVDGVSARSNDSLTVTGTPCSGPHVSPRPRRASAAWASARAAAYRLTTTALRAGFTRSIWAIWASTASTADRSPRAISPANVLAERRVQAAPGDGAASVAAGRVGAGVNVSITGYLLKH